MSGIPEEYAVQYWAWVEGENDRFGDEIVTVDGYVIIDHQISTEENGDPVFLSDVLEGDGDLADYL